jgi:hypothetical protein
LNWQEEIDNAGRVAMRYDGQVNPDNNQFERERVAESIYGGILGMVNIAERGNTYIYDENARGHKGELFMSSRLLPIDGRIWLIIRARLSGSSQPQTHLAWILLKDTAAENGSRGTVR